ncbi:hypothetical protein H0H92_008111 [Tricholoma furcatifolium]|nr:hypothetical protein H0H92_008111 [Tricholoma furcatifolium]
MMLVSSSLVSFVLLSLSLPSSALDARTPSLITVPLTPLLNLNALQDLVRNDITRIQNYFKGQTKLQDRYYIDEGVTNTAVGYTAVIGVGDPLATCTEWLDQITITQELVVANQSIGVANNATGVDYDGIFGIGPVDLTRGTLNDKNDTIPTVTDNAYSQDLITSNEIGVYFEPYSESQSGELTWGMRILRPQHSIRVTDTSTGSDNTRNYVGELIYAPVTSTKPAGYYWGVDSVITYGTTKLLASAGIVDTGTTLVQLATDAFNVYRNATGAVLDSKTGLLRITEAQFAKVKSLFFVISGVPFELTPNAQLWPRSLNTQIGGSKDYLYLIVSDIGHPSGSGLDFIAGYTFLERFYTVYDTSNKRVGFARTQYTNATTN